MTAPETTRPASYPYRWRSRKQHPERWGQWCRIVKDSGRTGFYMSHGSTAKSVIEFEDGTRVGATRGSIRLRAVTRTE